MRTRHTFRFPPNLSSRLADYAARKRVSQAAVVEAAVASHLSPDGADRLEAALARRLDRMARQIERLERHVKISQEAVALFVGQLHHHANGGEEETAVILSPNRTERAASIRTNTLAAANCQ